MFGFRSEYSNSQEIPEDLFKEIDFKLTHFDNLSDSIFDENLINFPSSDYLIGMRCYNNCINGQCRSSKEYISKKIEQFDFLSQQTYILLALGTISLKEGETTKAKELYLKSLQSDQKRRNKWVRLELYYILLNENKELAKVYLLEALEIDNEFRTAVVEKINLLIEESHYSEALSLLFENIDKYPNAEYLIYLKGLCYFQLDHKEAAEKSFKESLAIKQSVDGLTGLAYVEQFMNKDLLNAEELYKQIITIDKTNSIAHKQLIIIYIELNQVQKAKQLIDSMVLSDPSKENILQLAYINVLLNNNNEAKILVTRSIREFGVSKEDIFWKIMLASFDNDIVGAQEEINRFYKSYSEADILWLKSELKNWGVNIEPK